MAGLGVRLITEARLDPAVVRGNLGVPRSHFGQRAEARGISSVPGDVLRAAIQWAVRGDCIDFAEYMFCVCSGKKVYRFRVAEGLFFALVGDDGRPVTLYTADMMATVRRARKASLRGKGRKKDKRHGPRWCG